jgi:caffeoyl-CoA O-methyltransferase
MKMNIVDKKIEEYAKKMSNLPGKDCQELAAYTRENEDLPQMLVGELEGSFLGFLMRSLSPKRVLEIGTFSGYSALLMAESLDESSELITIDIEPKHYTKSYWEKSPKGKMIRSIQGNALEVVDGLEGPFDFVFIDADKENYLNYVQLVLPKLSAKGVIAVDNVLWSGKVLEEKPSEKSTQGIVEMNKWVQNNPDLYGMLMPLRDGIFLIMKNNF